jgi:hypothetical protein
MRSRAITVTTTATVVLDGTMNSPDDYLVKNVYLKPTGADVYLGGSDVTTANGFNLANNTTFYINLNPGQSLYAVVGTGSHALSVLEDS